MLLPSGLLGMDTSITDSQGAFRPLECTQALVRDSDGTIRHWSAGMERLYGYSRNDAFGRCAHELLKTEFPKPSGDLSAELFRNEFWHGELTNHRKDGTRVCVAAQWSIWRNGGLKDV